MDYAVLIMLPNQKMAWPAYFLELETMTNGQSNGDTSYFEDTKTEVEEKAFWMKWLRKLTRTVLWFGLKQVLMIQDIKQKTLATMQWSIWIWYQKPKKNFT
jgi:hypothetical protein